MRQRGEVGPSSVVERDDLAVEDRRAKTKEFADLALGNVAVSDLSLRDSARTRPSSTYTMARTPSHLNSYAHPSSDVGSSPASTSIAATCSGIGS